ncbi:hypothetical protein [Bacillus infantis]|jgi:hypothetical protein|uniref:hypothetical protein n=1 Tax=Bacillus infantis TaxID=324767 RepID=UPI002155B597|nr:hypothetical protein [Bacillus infantis]MCR6611395.1 hypothetical protein [Bacillus infantis]
MGAVLEFESTSIVLDDFIGTTDRYFGISDKEYTYTHNIHLFVERVKEVSYREVLSKTQVINYIHDKLKKYDMTITEVFLTKNPIPIAQVKDSFGKKIFQNNNDEYGWMVFVDPCKIANWSHPCEYWFIINKNLVYISYEEQWKPNKDIDLEVLR